MSRFPLLRIMLGNAFLLSAIYLVFGFTLETARQLFSFRWAERLLLVLDALPARALDLLGAMAVLRERYAYGRVSELTLRLIFGVTTLGIIFATAACVGAAMWLLRGWLTRRAGGHSS